ncbi:MAG: hypothetical protein JO121_10330 [Deltaproteobacteria bacterium]|nr:hypothetical protein [Deltaproteobacteria bacterium]
MVPSPTPAAVSTPAPVRSDPCGGYAELLKKYLSASPCVFVAGQAGLQMTYSGTNVPEVLTHSANGKTTTFTISSHAFGYPGALLHVGVSPTSQITIVLPSFSQISSTQNGTVAGTNDVEFRYKQLVYWNPKGGVLGGVLASYQAPTGSPALGVAAPSYEINPLLNIALNKARSIAENLSFPVTNAPAGQPGGSRTWSFAPQAVTVWRSPGGTLLAIIGQYGFSSHTLYLTLNTAQLIARNFQIQGTYGGNNAPVDYVNPVQDIPRAVGTAYSRSFTIGFSYLMGHSEALAR